MDFVAVDDFGHIINPMVVHGQVHGGLAQGVGQAMLENCVYDDFGQLLTGFYGLPCQELMIYPTLEWTPQ